MSLITSASTILPALVRAADFIGQLADPMYLCKVGALFHEFEETGTNSVLGYKYACGCVRGVPQFFLGCGQ